MKKTALLLALLMIGAAAASCGDAGSAPQTTDQAQTGAPTSEAETEPVFDPFAGLPEKNYDNYDFRILVRPLERWTRDMIVEEESGDIVDDEIFRRNSRVSEKYGINIVGIPSSHSNYETDAVKPILANEDAYDLVVTHGRAAFTYANQGLVLDWNTELPCINLDAPWWDQDARNSFSINDKLYVMTGDISYCSMSAANVMLFNKELLANLDMEFPYQAVLDGKWTFEMFDGMVRDGTYDLDGNGVIEQDHDRYGYVTQKWVGPVQAFATAGLRVLEKDEHDIPYISFYSERTVQAFDRYFNLMDSGNAFVDIADVSYSAGFINIFEEGRSLFIDMNMADVITMRSMATDFGIIPWPKYDESSDYCTNVDAGTNMCVIPITVADPERTSIILEALSAIGYERVIPAYYEVALQTKTSRDNESADMLDIIKSARVFDLGYYNDKASGKLANEFVSFAESPAAKRDLASWYETNVKASETSLAKVIEEYMD